METLLQTAMDNIESAQWGRVFGRACRGLIEAWML